jgi:signal transduction histidine kinase
MNSADISKGLISEKYIQDNLARIFPDSIILKDGFRITAVSSHVTTLLGLDAHKLVGRSVQDLSDDATLLKEIQLQLAGGFFDNLPATLKGRDGTIRCKLSGFYLGLICDINGIAILKVEVQDEMKLLSNQLEASRNELDEFVYRTTHDLRGPVATIRGLINLMKLESDSFSNDLKNLVGLMDTQAQTLDDRLFNLNYVAETSYSKADLVLDCAALETTMRATLEQSMVINTTEFQVITPQRIYNGVDAHLTTAMLNHLLLYLITLPKEEETKVTYFLEPANLGTRVTIYAEGFLSNYQIRQVVKERSPLYTTIILYSELINFFGAMKNAQRIGATINVDFIYEQRQQMSIWIPGQ